MRIFFFIFIFTIFICVAGISGQVRRSCNRAVVYDKDRRGFDELAVISLDVNRDGLSDKLIPSVSQTRGKSGIQHWIAFDVKISGQEQQRRFFRYMYGGEETYWVWALIPCRVNQDKYPDLLFYSGDDTSDERIYLVNTKNSFRVFRRPGPKSLGN